MRPILGPPGVSDESRWGHKYVFRDGRFEALRNGGWFDALKCRDVFVSGQTAPSGVLQPGLFMGQVGTSSRWAPSFFGKTTANVLHGGTSVTVGAVQAQEVVRRLGGSTGTLLIVGVPAAGAPAQVGWLTLTAADTTTGVLTVAATGGNETATLNIQGTPSAGNFRLLIQQPDGTLTPTGTVAHNATFATVISNINTALDAVLGAGAVVASGASYPAITFTYSGATQALRNAKVAFADVGALTGATTATITEATPGYYGTFLAGALIGANDGSFYPKSFIPPGYGIMVASGDNTPTTEQWPLIPIAGMPEWAQCAPLVTERGIRVWLADMMSGNAPGAYGYGSNAYAGKFNMTDFYNSNT